ncbi:hypothetical protein PZA11_005919 [Diplocarpon coronariae]
MVAETITTTTTNYYNANSPAVGRPCGGPLRLLLPEQKAECIPLPSYVGEEFAALSAALEEWRGEAPWQQEGDDDDDDEDARAVSAGNREMLRQEAVRRARILVNLLLVASAEAPTSRSQLERASLAELRSVAEATASQLEGIRATVAERGDLIESRLARLEQSSRTMLGLLGSIAASVERTAVAAESLVGGGGLAVARVASGAAASRAAPAAARGGGRGRSGRGRVREASSSSGTELELVSLSAEEEGSEEL